VLGACACCYVRVRRTVPAYLTPHIAALHPPTQQQGEELAQLDKRVIALSLLSRLPVISCTSSTPQALPAAAAATGDTWPVYHMPHMPEDVRMLVKVGNGER
jgi:hypothetical protein